MMRRLTAEVLLRRLSLLQWRFFPLSPRTRWPGTSWRGDIRELDLLDASINGKKECRIVMY